MKYKAAIFDMDGLLLDTERIFLDAFKKTSDTLGFKFDMALFIKLIGTNSLKTKEIMINSFDKGFNYDLFRETWVSYVDDYLSRNPIPLKEGAAEILDKIKEISLPMAVATSTRYSDALKSLESTGIVHYFEFVVAGDQVTKGKPDPEIYLKAAQKLDAVPEECVVFEDSENGVKSAYDAGMDVIQVPDLLEPSDELMALGHRVYGSLGEVCRNFEKIFAGFSVSAGESAG